MSNNEILPSKLVHNNVSCSNKVQCSHFLCVYILMDVIILVARLESVNVFDSKPEANTLCSLSLCVTRPPAAWSLTNYVAVLSST